MLKAFKYRIYPNDEQKKKFAQTFGVCRLVYNTALDVKSYAWKTAGKNLSAYDLKKQLPELKKEYPWISEPDSQALQATILNLDKAYDRFFKGGGYPKFKKKSGHQSFQCPGGKREINWDKSTLTIPKIQDIPIVLHRKFDGKIKTVTISKTPTGKYFASILVDNEKELPIKNGITTEKTVGIDVGIKSFVITSDGKVYEPNRYLKNSLKRLQCLQRRASRKKKGSKNRKKANIRVAGLHEKITNQRNDYTHKTTKMLISDNQTETFCIENLNVAGMVKNHKLSQAISDVSFGEFFRQLKYKAEWAGKNVIVIDRFAPSSKRCSECGEIKEILTLQEREWTCECGAHHDRDINAAKNIKFFGLNNSGAGSSGEPVELRRLRRA